MSAPPDITHVSSHDYSSRPLSGIKKFIAEKRRSSEVQSDAGSQTPDLKPSLTSPLPDKSPSRVSTAQSSPSRDDASSKSGSSGVRKLIPGHSKRKRRKARDKELKAAEEELGRGRSPTGVGASTPDLNRSVSSLAQEGDSGLLTDDEDTDLTSAPSLVSRESHNGYLTTSSPLLKSSAGEAGQDGGTIPESKISPTRELPQISVSEQHGATDSIHHVESAPTPGLVDRADSLRVESDDRGRRGSISRLRGISPGRKLKEVFTNKHSKSPRTSPERKSTDPFAGGVGNLWNKSGTLSERHLPPSPTSAPARASTFSDLETPEKASRSMTALDTIDPPRTPPGTGIGTPLTTITPPTPTLPQHPDNPSSPRRHTEAAVDPYDSNTVVAPSGNMISHRRTRSGSSLKQPSKLSSSIFPPLTPLEETRTPPSKEGDKDPISRNATPSSGFFSSWVSAAQNAATTLTTTINTHTRTASTSSKPKEAEGKASEETVRETPVAKIAPPESPKKQKAIETLGSGDLDFSHLGFDPAAGKSTGASRPDLEDLRKNSTIQRDEAAAKIEDMLARRAVSAAYEAPSDTTPIAEVPDPLQSLKHTQTSTSLLGEQTPPNGSIYGDDSGSIKRSNSMRSRLRKRRSRGSSVATGTSTIGAAIVGASTSTLANPATGPRLSGFATAPKPRNRAFHQAFRSVPEDDYLIEDYSCALQKEILLAGRIYISEGHICFSSNILGWVTTLVISFEEIVSIERESTAMVFPNAIAIQTLHARHTFRSLLSREATFELMIGIWKVSHPASFKKSVNGKQLMQEEAAKTQDAVHDALATEEDIAKSEGSSDESDSEESDGDGSEGSDASLAGSGASMAPSDNVDAKSLKTKTSGLNGSLAPPGADGAVAPEGSFGLAAPASAEQQLGEGLGPATHAPTDCNDASTHYEKVCKDEIIAAPLGKIYSLLYGPLSGTFVRKYLLEDQKALDLQMDDDKKGLSNEGNKSRQYTYIKPLGGSIGPKQTKCITTENLDFCDFEKSVSVTCTTQTPDVPSGSAFSTKTRYCLSWAPNNSTRLQMTCGIEWTAKSWLKSPIEKGANDGQQSYGDGLVKALRAFVEGGTSPKKGASRERGATGVSKSSKKKKHRSSKKDGSGSKTDDKKAASAWGPLEPLHSLLEPIIDLLGPIAHPWTLVAILLIYVTISWIRSPSSSSLSSSSSSSSLPGSAFLSPPHRDIHPARLAAYDELWRNEESDLWDWLESRTGVLNLRTGSALLSNRNEHASGSKTAKSKSGGASAKELERKLREEKMGQRAMEDMLRVTRERLEVLERVVERRGKGGAN